MNKYVELHSGRIYVETDPGDIEVEKNIDNESSLANKIWNKLRPF